MRLIAPNVQWWPQISPWQQIARVGRICYKSIPKEEPDANLSKEGRFLFREQRDKQLCARFWTSGHKSMYRHGTLYFFFPTISYVNCIFLDDFSKSPYISIVEQGGQDGKAWVSANMQFAEEHSLQSKFESFIVSEETFIAKAKEFDCQEALNILRMTLVVTTQISTSRELNRTSPNCIAEQSTRYCNLEKKGGVMIAMPRWMEESTWWQRFLYLSGCKIADWLYRHLLKTGMKPQDARGILPLDTYTVVAYTYTLKEWKHILDLRYYERTGKAHPNAKLIGERIAYVINLRMKAIFPEFII